MRLLYSFPLICFASVGVGHMLESIVSGVPSFLKVVIQLILLLMAIAIDRASLAEIVVEEEEEDEDEEE